MSINFTDSLNQRIQRVVEQYNSRRRSALKSHRQTDVPPRVTVKQLKTNYLELDDLLRELDTLEAFSATKLSYDPLEKVSEYDKEVIALNKKATIQFMEQKKAILERRIAKGKLNYRTTLENLQLNLDIMRKPEITATSSELYAQLAQVRKYRENFGRRAGGYRGFLSEVEFVMKNVGIPKSERDAFFNKFSKLNPNQFELVYEEYGIVERVYDLAGSPPYGEAEIEMNADADYAKILIEEMMSQADEMVNYGLSL